MMNTIKPHIGVFVIALIGCYFPYIFKSGCSDEFGVWVPASAACMLFVFIEVAGWVLFWCFS